QIFQHYQQKYADVPELIHDFDNPVFQNLNTSVSGWPVSFVYITILLYMFFFRTETSEGVHCVCGTCFSDQSCISTSLFRENYIYRHIIQNQWRKLHLFLGSDTIMCTIVAQTAIAMT